MDLKPQSTTQACAMLSQRLQSGQRVTCVGAGTRLEPSGVDGISTALLNQVRFFDPEDLVIGVEAGLPYGTLHNILAEKGMFLPVSPWFAKATIGGMAAAGDWGPERLDGGGMRDALIGLEYINGAAAVVKSGGKVVKNVTGYDIARLMLGSMGGLGLITALNFKLKPTPIQPHSLFLEQAHSPLPQFRQGVFEARLPIEWAQIVQVKGGFQIGMGVSGNSERRERLINQIQVAFDNKLTVSPETQTPQRFQHFAPSCRHGGFLSPHQPSGDHTHLHLITTNRFLMAEDGLTKLTKLRPSALILHPVGADAHLFWPHQDPQETAQHVEQLSRHGSVTLVRSQPALKQRLGWVTPKPAAYAVMQRLKAAMDPANLYHAPFYTGTSS